MHWFGHGDLGWFNVIILLCIGVVMERLSRIIALLDGIYRTLRKPLGDS